MAKFDCDIICDLLPSYIDGICTTATRRCVKEHLAECPACAEKAGRLRETALSGEGLERIALDAVKKIKRRAVWRTAVHLALFLPFFTFGSLGLNLALRGRNVIFTGQFLPEDGFVLLAVCLLICALFLRGRKPGLQKADQLALAVSLAVMAASIGLMLHSYFTVISKIFLADGPAPVLFGLVGPRYMGPVLHTLYGALFFLQAAAFLWALFRLWKRGMHTVPVLQTAMTGMMLPMQYLSLLCSMDLDFDTGAETILYRQLQDTGTALLIGAAGIIAGLLVSKWRGRKKKVLPF